MPQFKTKEEAESASKRLKNSIGKSVKHKITGNEVVIKDVDVREVTTIDNGKELILGYDIGFILEGINTFIKTDDISGDYQPPK